MTQKIPTHFTLTLTAAQADLALAAMQQAPIAYVTIAPLLVEVKAQCDAQIAEFNATPKPMAAVAEG